MILGRNVLRRSSIIALMGFMLAASGNSTGRQVCAAGQDGALSQLATHHHSPIVVHSRPVIERIPVQVIHPTDLCSGPDGILFVADSAARCVFQIGSDGNVALAVKDIADIVRIVSDSDANLYVLTASHGTSAITQVTPDGLQVELCSIPFHAGSFVRDSIGQFVVSESGSRVARVSPEGEWQHFAVCPSAIADLAISSSGQVHALLEDSRVLLIQDDGGLRLSGFAQAGSARLLSLPEGDLAALSATPGERPLIAGLRTDASEDLQEFAKVPLGTVAVAFDRLGNLSMANPDLRAVTRVTSHFVVPCPHCGAEVPMHLSPALPVEAARRSF